MTRKHARSLLASNETRKSSPIGSADPDDAPAWTADQLARAELADGGEVLRAAQGTLKRGPGRPKLESPKKQVSVRLDPEVLTALRREGPGWQRRMNDTLRKALKIA